MSKTIKPDVVPFRQIAGITVSGLLVKVKEEGQAVLNLPSTVRAGIAAEMIDKIPGLQATIEGTTKVIATLEKKV